MPKQLTAEMPLDTLEDECLYTAAALEADGDAKDLVGITAEWLSALASVRASGFELRKAIARADARRFVANGKLDAACTAFGDELYLAVGKDRASARWKTFFPVAVSSFVKQALERQLAAVKGWLTLTNEPTLEKQRSSLQQCVAAVDAALVDTRAVAPQRGVTWQAREALADGLTRDRDGLHAALVQRAKERGLARSWPDLFFRVDSRPAKEEQPETETIKAPA